MFALTKVFDFSLLPFVLTENLNTSIKYLSCLRIFSLLEALDFGLWNLNFDLELLLLTEFLSTFQEVDNLSWYIKLCYCY